MSADNNLQVLNALDVAKTQLYHFTTIVIAGMGFFTDAYDLFSISLVTKLLGRLYYTKPELLKPGTLPPTVSASVTGVALVGTLAGQLFFGWLGDKMGRKTVYGMTLIIMVLCSVASGLSFGSTPKGVMATLCFFRFWLGFGIGGDYPLSPAEIFPARLRSTCHGISAAAGKAGAIVGAYGFLYAAQSKDPTKTDAGYPAGIGIKNSLIALGAINALGMVCTFCVPESKGKSLEEASQETITEE
nr:PREDICTED: probable inorganic phosphate transporter 1-3 [Nicotiana tabacum]